MKRRLFISVALSVVLAIMLPSLALAAKPVPLNASGVLTAISIGSVLPAGDSARFRVAERQISGVVSGDISGEFTMNYKGNVELTTQAGNIHGTIEVGAFLFKFSGTSEPLQMVYFAPYGVYLPMLAVNGHWTFTKGAKGQGDIQAFAVFIPTPDGHVGTIVASGFVLSVEWQP